MRDSVEKVCFHFIIGQLSSFCDIKLKSDKHNRLSVPKTCRETYYMYFSEILIKSFWTLLSKISFTENLLKDMVWGHFYGIEGIMRLFRGH